VDGELVTASLFNAHVRDVTYLLKTNIDDAGAFYTGLQSFGFSAGQGNAGGGGDTQLTSYDVVIPANHMDQPGDCLVVRATLANSGVAGNRTCKMQVGGGTLITLFTVNVVTPSIIYMRIELRRRLVTTGSLQGQTDTGAHLGAIANAIFSAAALGAVDWTVAQTLKVFLAAANANDIFMTDYIVDSLRGTVGALV
jgi:hypothetical protein